MKHSSSSKAGENLKRTTLVQQAGIVVIKDPEVIDKFSYVYLVVFVDMCIYIYQTLKCDHVRSN